VAELGLFIIAVVLQYVHCFATVGKTRDLEHYKHVSFAIMINGPILLAAYIVVIMLSFNYVAAHFDWKPITFAHATAIWLFFFAAIPFSHYQQDLTLRRHDDIDRNTRDNK
jgi:hypothetical protein